MAPEEDALPIRDPMWKGTGNNTATRVLKSMCFTVIWAFSF
jgi:hypothetical protein